MVSNSALTVSQLNMYVKMMFESDSRLKRICVVGEISNFVNHYKTGHCYFSLKDSDSSVKAVMFARNAQFLKFRPENGMRVYVTGRVSVFERDGVYQLYADSMEPEGAGALMLAFEQLKNKLASEGLFDDNRKREIPAFPLKIAVVTSPVGAAVQDVINILSRRFPLTEMILCPVAVQGVNCAKENISALKKLEKINGIDVIILCRGGGSVEDLWGYNDENLVRAVAASKVPVITGIGHETDFTLCDFAADLRAPTPSAAAELAVPDIEELYQVTDALISRLYNSVDNYINNYEEKFLNLKYRLSLLEPKKKLENNITVLESLNTRLNAAKDNIIQKKEEIFNILTEKLRLLNPLEMIAKGYVPIYENGKRVIKAKDLKINSLVSINFSDGGALCEVKEISLTSINE